MKREISELIRSQLDMPSIFSCRNIVVVQPHPDDADIAIGGTVKKLTDSGIKVTYITVCDGGMGTLDPEIDEFALSETRKKEQLSAAEILGVSECIFLGFPDSGDYGEETVCADLVNILRDINPDFLLTVDPFLNYEFHTDHIKCGKSAVRAALFRKFPHFHPGKTLKDFRNLREIEGIGFFFSSNTNTIVDLDKKHFDAKMDAVRCHASQLEGMEKLLEYMSYKSQIMGKKIGADYAEGITVFPLLALHAFPEVEYL